MGNEAAKAGTAKDAGAVVYTDHSEFCCRVLRARVADGSLPAGRIIERDVREFGVDDIGDASHVHLFAGIGGFPLGMKWAGWPRDRRTLTGGFPCQDVSMAGKGAGIDGARSGLWSEMLRVADAFRPDWIIVENVPGLLHRGFDRVCGELEGIGYAWQAVTLDGTCVCAPMLGRRIFIIAEAPVVSADSAGLQGRERSGVDRTQGDEGRRRAVVEPVRSMLHRWPAGFDEVSSVPTAIDGLPGGLAERAKKIEAIGNAVMPQLVELVCRAVMESDHEQRQ